MEVERIGTEVRQTEQNEWDKLGDPIELLRDTAIDMVDCAEGELASDFPHGVYLYHGAKVEQIEEIFESGAIMNAGAVYETKLNLKRNELREAGKSEEEIEAELKKVWITHNSGQEGISWSANGIDALPGTRGHIAGFLAAPEVVLGENKLVIPSRPAPYELLQISDGIDTEKFFEAKKQYEVWGYRNVSLDEMASVDSGLVFLILARGDKGKEESYFKSLLSEFAQRGGLSAEELRKHYEVAADGRVKIDDTLHQQKYNEQYLPPAAVWMQYMVDAGMFNGTEAEGLDVNGLIEMAAEREDLTKYMLYHAREQGKRYADGYEAKLDESGDVVTPVEKMYLVTSHHDLEHWLEVIKRTGHRPRGILFYDDEKVVRENFAQKEHGDHAELAKEIGHAVGVDGDFWPEKMGLDVEGASRTGTQGQVLVEDVVDRSKEVRVVGGELVIESTKR